VRTNPQKGIYEVYLDDEKIAVPVGNATVSSFEIPSLPAVQGKQYILGFLVDADMGATVEVAAEGAKVTRTRR
jgi:hypothetical protein